MHDHLDLPIHPTKRHPLTGEPLQAIYVRKDGRAMWPIIGAAPDGDDTGGAGGAGGNGDDTGGGGGNEPSNATDEQGRDLGYPKDTPIAEMNDKQEAAYWRHNARKHEGKWKGIAGDRKLEDVQKDLEELAEIRKAQQTPAEQALTAARDEGKTEGIKAARAETAATIFRGALEAAEMKAEDVDDLVSNFNVANFVTDTGVDTTKITNFAKRFTKSVTDDSQQQRRRDYGGGNRGGGTRTGGGSVAQVMADRAAERAAKNSNSTS